MLLHPSQKTLLCPHPRNRAASPNLQPCAQPGPQDSGGSTCTHTSDPESMATPHVLPSLALTLQASQHTRPQAAVTLQAYMLHAWLYSWSEHAHATCSLPRQGYSKARSNANRDPFGNDISHGRERDQEVSSSLCHQRTQKPSLLLQIPRALAAEDPSNLTDTDLCLWSWWASPRAGTIIPTLPTPLNPLQVKGLSPLKPVGKVW